MRRNKRINENLIAAGVSKQVPDDRIDEIEQLPEYKAFMGIYGLQKPEWWTSLSLMGETDLREHKLLSPLAKALRAKCRKLNSKEARNAKAAQSHDAETTPGQVCV